MNRVKFTILAIMVAITAYLLLIPAQPDAVWLKWLSIALWIVLIVIIVRNSDLFERPKVEKEVKPEDVLSPKLLAFLKEKGVFEEFMINYNRKSGVAWRRRINTNNISIARSFDWEDTSQGWDYWNDLNDEYEYQQNKKS